MGTVCPFMNAVKFDTVEGQGGKKQLGYEVASSSDE